MVYNRANASLSGVTRGHRDLTGRRLGARSPIRSPAAGQTEAMAAAPRDENMSVVTYVLGSAAV